MSKQAVSKKITKKVAKADSTTNIGKEKSEILKGRYVYGVAHSRKELSLGQIGIEGSNVYTIPYRSLCAIVHDCPTEPYRSNNKEVVKEWVKVHQKVLDKVKERFGTVIPLTFDVIIHPKDNVTLPEQMVKDWLSKDYDRLTAMIQKIKGKNEYGIQISYDPKLISESIAKQSKEVKGLKKIIATQSPGMAYMYKQKLEKVVKAGMEKLADERFKDFYERIKKHTDDIVVEKTKRLKDKVMLLNLCCLVRKEKVESLGEELEKIDNLKGFSVHFSGPWPAYSFVRRPFTLAKQKELK
jgi:hypothetical protein